VRIIAATHQNLAERVKSGLFRRDLYYRLNGVPIEIPPLRERAEDIVPIAVNFLSKLNQAHGTRKKMSADVLDALQKYNYPGNIRELVHIVERMFTMSEKDVFDGGELPAEVRSVSSVIPHVGRGDMTLEGALDAFEEHIIRDVLKRSSTPQEAAQALGIHYSTLWRKLKKFRILLRE
jgi:transcriptional regulator with PAS, ATPase and Fis domain